MDDFLIGFTFHASLSPSVQDMYRLVFDLATEVVSESDEHLESSFEKANRVLPIDRYIRETISEFGNALRESSNRAYDLRLYRFHAHPGDYAGALCKSLKELWENKRKSSKILSQPWTTIMETSDKHHDKVTTWIASGRDGSKPRCPAMDAIREGVIILDDKGFKDVDVDLALYAIRSYARRNFVCHGQLSDLDQSNDFAGLAKCIVSDDNHLERLVPDEEQPMVGKWRRILTFYGDLHIRQNSSGV